MTAPVPRASRLLPPLLLLLCVAGQAAAQSNVVAPPPPPREGTVGPEQLRDFSLGGTRPQPAEQAPAQQPAPTRTPDRTPTSETATLPRPAPAQRGPASATTAGQQPPASSAPAATRPAPSASVALPPASSTDSGTADLAPAAPAAPASEPVSITPTPLPTTDESGGMLGYWPWLLAVLAVAAGAFFLGRRRTAQQADPGRLAFAGGMAAPSPEPTPAPAPAPRPAPPVQRGPAPAPMPAPDPAPSPVPSGIVSTRLRAWVECSIGVRAVVLTEDELQLHLDLLVENSGSVPARNVAIEALVLNAGPDQDKDLQAFYARPDTTAYAAEIIPPGGQIPLQPVVRMARSAFREYAAAGGKAVVPILAFNVGYRAGSVDGRSSAAMLVGPPAKGGNKLAPFRTDEGARTWTQIGMITVGERIRR